MKRISDAIAEDIEDILANTLHGSGFDYDLEVGVMPSPDGQGSVPICQVIFSAKSTILGEPAIVGFGLMPLDAARNKDVLKLNIERTLGEIREEQTARIANKNGRKPG